MGVSTMRALLFWGYLDFESTHMGRLESRSCCALPLHRNLRTSRWASVNVSGKPEGHCPSDGIELCMSLLGFHPVSIQD